MSFWKISDRNANDFWKIAVCKKFSNQNISRTNSTIEIQWTQTYVIWKISVRNLNLKKSNEKKSKWRIRFFVDWKVWTNWNFFSKYESNTVDFFYTIKMFSWKRACYLNYFIQNLARTLEKCLLKCLMDHHYLGVKIRGTRAERPVVVPTPSHFTCTTFRPRTRHLSNFKAHAQVSPTKCMSPWWCGISWSST